MKKLLTILLSFLLTFPLIANVFSDDVSEGSTESSTDLSIISEAEKYLDNELKAKETNKEKAQSTINKLKLQLTELQGIEVKILSSIDIYEQRIVVKEFELKNDQLKENEIKDIKDNIAIYTEKLEELEASYKKSLQIKVKIEDNIKLFEKIILNNTTVMHDISLPWTCIGCHKTIDEKMCQDPYKFINWYNTLKGVFCGHNATGGFSQVVYCAPKNYSDIVVNRNLKYEGAFVSPWRTSWWKGYLDKCYELGYIKDLIYHNYYYGSGGANVSFNLTKKATPENPDIAKEKVFSGTILSAKKYDEIIIQGSSMFATRIKTPTFNSPFIYFLNPPKEEIKTNILSNYNEYNSQLPKFNINDGWLLNSDGKDIYVDGNKQDYLFYKLALRKVSLSRYGKNFSTKEDLINFLNNGEFFDKLGLTDLQKQNTLTYILPQIEDSENYYLTILNEKSVNEISKLNIDPNPKNLIRKYFVIYPTKIPVKTYGDMKYPQLDSFDNYSVVETGEFYLKNDTIIIWEK